MDKNILVIVDVQNDFIDGSLGNLNAAARIPNIINLIKSTKWDVIFVTRDTHDNDYLRTKEGEKLPIEHCIKNTNGWEINSKVQEALNECEVVRYINKDTFGYDSWEHAFGEFDFEICDDLNIVMCGFCTDICVISNALAIKTLFPYHGEVSIIEECCAGVSTESHKAALTVMKNCQINII